MLNFGGLGIEIEYDDDGAQKDVEGLSGAVGGLTSNLKRVGSLFGTAGRGLKRGFTGLTGAGRRGIGGITSAITGMIDAAQNPQLDDAYASMYAGFNKSFSAMTVGIKATSSEMARARKVIGGAAFSLNEDMDQAAETWAAFRKQGIDLGKVLGTKGLSGQMKDLIKVTAVFGIEGEQLATVMAGLVRGFGFTEDQVGGLADKLYLVGKQFDAGREAVQAWPAIFEALNNELADFGKNMSPEDIEKLTLSVVQLGGGLSKSLGIPAQSAMEIARTAFTTLAGERKNIINMFRGMGGEFGEVAKQLMESGGDANEVFRMMAEGDPLKFMDTLRAMSEEAQKRGGESSVAFQRLSAVMSSAIGPDVAFAAKGSWDKVHETMAGIPDVIAGGKARGALKQAARAHHKTGLTAGEGWDRMVEGMKARLFRLSDKEIGGWQKNMKKGFDETFGVISKLAKADGPVGELTKRLLAVQRVGLSALLPGLEGMMPLLGGVMSSLIPVMTALGSMGLTFGSLGKMALGGGALWGVFYLLQKGPKEAIAGIRGFATDVWDTLSGLFPDLKTKAEEYFDYVSSGELFDDISKQLNKVDISGTLSMAGDFLHTLMLGVGDAISRIDWNRVVGMVFSAVMSAAASLGGFIAALFGGVDRDMEQVEGQLTASVGTMLVNVLNGARVFLVNAMGSFWDQLLSAGSVGEAMSKIAKMFVGGTTALLVISGGFRRKFLRLIKGTMSGSVKAMSGGFRGMARSAGRGMMKVGSAIKTGLKAAGPMMAIMAIFEGIQQAEEKAVAAAKIMSDATIRESEKAALAAEQGFLGVLNTIDAVFLGLPSSVGKALGITMDDVSRFYHDMVAGMETGIASIVEFFSMGVDTMRVTFGAFGEMFMQGWNWMSGLVEGIVNEIVLAWKTAVSTIELGMNSLAKGLETTFTSIAQHVMYPFKLLSHKFKKWISDLLTGLFGTERDPTALGNLVKKIDSDLFDKMGKTAKTMRIQWTQEGGDDFTDRYFERAKKEMDQVNAKYEQRANAIRGDMVADEDRAMKNAAQIKAAQDRSVGKMAEVAMGAVAQNLNRYGEMSKNISRYSSDAMEAANEAAETSKRMRKEAEGSAAETTVEQEKIRQARRKKVRVPSTVERADMAKPKDPGVRALVETVTTMNSAMTQFFQKPIDVSVNVQGDIGKFMRFSAQQDRKRVPSPVAR